MNAVDQPPSRTAPDAAASGHLKEGLTMIDVVSIGVGSAVGVSIFSIMAPAAKVAGTGMLAALALASIPMIIFAVVYAFMGSAVPRSGASFEWPARFIHPFVGFMVAWLRVVGNTGALTVLTLVLVSYASRAVTLPQKPTMFVLLLAFYLANLFGVRIAGGVERVLVLFKLIAFAVFVVLGLSYVQPGNFQPLLGPGWGAMFASLPRPVEHAAHHLRGGRVDRHVRQRDLSDVHALPFRHGARWRAARAAGAGASPVGNTARRRHHRVRSGHCGTAVAVEPRVPLSRGEHPDDAQVPE